MHSTCTLDVLDNIVGGEALQWSADHCIAAATSKSVILYELNPLDDPGSQSMSFKVQVLPAGKPLEYDTGVKKILDAYDELRIIPSKTAAAPNYEVYHMYLDPSLLQLSDGPQPYSAGYTAVGFSCLNCALGGGTVLATLTACHRLQVYSRSSDGTLIRWSEVHDLSDILVNILKKNSGYYPVTDFPANLKKVKKIWEKQYAAYTTCFAWHPAVMTNGPDDQFTLLVTCTKNNYALLWRLEVPVCKNSKISLLSCTKTSQSISNRVAWLNDGFSGCANFAVGGSGGTISCFKVDVKTGQCIMQNHVWPHNDELSVTSMQWSKAGSGTGETVMIASKGCIVLCLKISEDLQLLSSTHLKGAHVLPITNIEVLKIDEWLTCSQDGCLMRIWLKQSRNKANSKLSLDYEVMEKSSIVPSPLIPQTHHFAVVSPSHAFLARLCSKPRISATVQVENSGFVLIKTLQNGLASINSILRNPEWREPEVHPQIDLLESIRLHLVRKDLEKDEADLALLQMMLVDFIKSHSQHFEIKWFILQMLSPSMLPIKKYGTYFQEVEKKILIQQMIKVLKMWKDHRSAEARSPPVRNIVGWLHNNEKFMTNEDKDFVVKLKKSNKFNRTKQETCSVTGEGLSMSEDARYAFTKESGVRWSRCCLTFCALQEYKVRKCELANSPALLPSDADDEYMKILLKGPSIYSARAMI